MLPRSWLMNLSCGLLGWDDGLTRLDGLTWRVLEYPHDLAYALGFFRATGKVRQDGAPGRISVGR